jgi:iron complex transport system permease protein
MSLFQGPPCEEASMRKTENAFSRREQPYAVNRIATLKINNMQAQNSIRWILLLVLLLLLFVLDVSLGSVHIPVSKIVTILFTGEGERSVSSEIVWNFRMTKALTCVLAGGGLAVAGLQMQTLFRNALAGPDVLGLSSGASLAVSLVFMNALGGLAFLSRPNPLLVSFAASLGSGGVLIVMLLVARKLQDNVSLLIIGLMVGAATASVVSVLQYLSKAEEMQVYILWTFGSLGSLNWQEIRILFTVLTGGVIVAFAEIKSLNAWLLGDHYARSLGINIPRARVMIILSASFLTGGVTAFCGPIAFVGLAVPHLTKLLIKSQNHKTLIPAVLMAGAALLLFCDILSRVPGTSYVLPINALTALIGAPVVIWIIIRNKTMRV